MNVLLDTCSLLWLGLEQQSLSDTARDLLVNPQAIFHVSSISAFEIGQKHAKGKLVLSADPETWFRRCLEIYGLVSIPLDYEVALRAAALPQIHSDPFDRLLIATAMVQGYVLLTPDEHIRQYPGVATMW
jgi:PIN domain nuclease of toxin-antitoxin system